MIKKYLNSILITTYMVLMLACQDDQVSRAPISSIEISSELDSTAILSYDCSKSVSNIEIYDAESSKINFCHLFDETSSELILIQPVLEGCLSCDENISYIMQQLKSTFSQRIQQVAMAEKSIKTESLEIEVDEVTLFQDKNDYFIKHFNQNPQKILAAKRGKIILMDFDSNTNFLDIIQTINTQFDMSLEKIESLGFEWDGSSDQGSKSWDIAN